MTSAVKQICFLPLLGVLELHLKITDIVLKIDTRGTLDVHHNHTGSIYIFATVIPMQEILGLNQCLVVNVISC